MQLCIIAPIPHLSILTAGSKMHLVLTQWILQDSRYVDFYRIRKAAGDYIIMDNGAHEESLSRGIDDLKRAADLILPDEVILPDILRNGMGTAHMTAKSYEPLSQHFDLHTKFMAVVHGKNPKEWDWCLRHQVEMPVHALGVPRVYADDFGSWIPALARIMDSSLRGRFDIHLLGAPHNLTHAAEVHKVFPKMVRSTDTAKPVHYALAGMGFKVPLDPEQRNVFSRPKDFLTHEMTPHQVSLSLENIHKFAQAIGAMAEVGK